VRRTPDGWLSRRYRVLDGRTGELVGVQQILSMHDEGVLLMLHRPRIWTEVPLWPVTRN